MLTAILAACAAAAAAAAAPELMAEQPTAAAGARLLNADELAPATIRCDAPFQFGPPSCSVVLSPTSLSIADTIRGGTISGTRSAGTSWLPPGWSGAAYAGPEVFFDLTIGPADAGSTLTFNTCGSNYDTVLRAFALAPRSADSSWDLAQLAENDDATIGPCTGTLQSYISLPWVRPGTYYIAIDGWSASSYGSFVLNWSISPPSSSCGCGFYSTGPGLPCSFTRPITGLPLFAYNTWYSLSGSLSSGAPYIPGGFSGPQAVFAISVPDGAVGLEITTCDGASWDTVLWVVRQCPRDYLSIQSLGLVAWNDDAGGSCGLQSRVVINNVAGGVYYVILQGYSSASWGTFSLRYRVTTGLIASGAGSEETPMEPAPIPADAQAPLPEAAAAEEEAQQHEL